MSRSTAEVEQLLREAYIAADGADLRDEDRKKAIEITALLEEIRRAVAATSASAPCVLVDAAAGNAYVGVLAARLVLAAAGRPARVVALDRDPARADAGRRAARRLASPVDVEYRVGDLGDAALWPDAPALVVALHACGPASDRVIDRSLACSARRLLLVPCCYGAQVPAERLAAALAATLGIPRHAPVRRRFAQAVVDAERTLRLEAAGYETQVVELVPPTVTPHNLLWRSRRVGEPGRAKAAAARLAALYGAGGGAAGEDGAAGGDGDGAAGGDGDGAAGGDG